MAAWMSTLSLSALLLISLTLISPLTTAAAQEYDFNKDQDLVVLLDRSQSIGGREFKAALDFLRTLIEVSMVVHPRYTRLAVLTFDVNVTVEFDHISSEADRQGGCALFGKDGSWSGVKWVEGKSGRDLSSSLRKVQSIFQVAKLSRSSARQVLMIVGDGEWFTSADSLQKAKLGTTILRDSGVSVYAVGIGNSLKRNTLKELVSQPSSYYYQDLGQWRSLILEKRILPKKVPEGDWFSIRKSSCSDCGSGADCYCQEYSTVPPLCLCGPGFYPASGQCQACDVGSYKDRLGNASCTSCQIVSKVTNPGLKRAQCGEVGSQAPVFLRYVLVGVCALVIIIVVIVCLCVFLRCRKKRHVKSVACGEDQKNIYTQTGNLNSAYDASATTTVDLINDVAMAHARLSDNSVSSYTAHRNSFESHHVYDYVDESARCAATMAVPEIVFTMTDSDSTSDNKRKRSSKNQFRNSKTKFSLRKRSRRMSRNKKIKKVSTSSSPDIDYDTVLARFKRQMLENRRRSSIESLERVGKVSAMVNMFERHAHYVSTSSLVRWQSEPRLPSVSNVDRHAGLKRQNSYVEPLHAISTTDLSSTTYASSSDEKPHRPKHVPMRIRNELDKASEGTDSDSSKRCTYLEVIRTPRPSSLETVASIATSQQHYANELLQPPPPVVNGRSNMQSALRWLYP